MSERKYRAQILLEPDQHAILVEKAQREGRSVSNVVREIVAEYIINQEQETHMQQEAFERLKQIRMSILAKRGGEPIDMDASELIEAAREERANELVTHHNNDRG